MRKINERIKICIRRSLAFSLAVLLIAEMGLYHPQAASGQEPIPSGAEKQQEVSDEPETSVPGEETDEPEMSASGEETGEPEDAGLLSSSDREADPDMDDLDSDGSDDGALVPPQAEGTEIDEQSFPDENLRGLVTRLADSDQDGRLSEEEISAVTSLDLSHSEICSLAGLEVFENLTELDCSWNHLHREDIEPFRNLEKLCYYNNTYLADTAEEEVEETEESAAEAQQAVPADSWKFTWISVVSAVEFQDVPIDGTSFPDEKFRSLVSERYDLDQDAVLSAEEQSSVTSLYARDCGIEDLTGLAYFKNLLLLDCSGNLLEDLDVTELLQLRGLYCRRNQLRTLDLTANDKLRQLECDDDVEVLRRELPENGDSEAQAAAEAVVSPTPTPTPSVQVDKAEKKITVGRASIQKLSNAKSEVLTATYKKVSQADGYQVQIALDAKFTKKKRTGNTTKTSYSFDKLLKDRTCYVRVRAFRYDSSKKKIYGKFSQTKSLRITKGRVMVKASSKAITLKSVTLSSAKTVKVCGSISKYIISGDGYYYLFCVAPSAGISASAKPIAKLTKRKSITFKVPLNYDKSGNRLQNRFVMAVKMENGKYQQVSAAKFISNPEKLAISNAAFPKSKTKKGLQVNEFHISDAAQLGVKHTTYNMCLDDLIATSAEKNKTLGISFRYAGTTYWFDKGIVESYDRRMNSFKKNKMIVSAIILLRYRSDLSYLMENAAMRGGFYALNTRTSKARKHLAAVFTFLARRYAATGKVANWIIGNEVNNYMTYHYTGSSSLSNNARVYTNAFRLAYIAIRSVYSKARLYISLNHYWNTVTWESHGTKQFLNAFAKDWASYGNFNIAFHPYPADLRDPEFWTNVGKGRTSMSGTTPFIDMGNLTVLTNYVKKNYGSSTRIILSEQGFTSVRYGSSVPKIQAAAIAYAYYLAEFNGMVDAFILHRQIDHQSEIDQGLSLGLWTRKSGTAETPDKKKYAWDVYRYMDTSKGASKTKFALSIIKKGSWKMAVPGYSAKRFS